jgi:hypothetical protein
MEGGRSPTNSVSIIPDKADPSGHDFQIVDANAEWSPTVEPPSGTSPWRLRADLAVEPKGLRKLVSWIRLCCRGGVSPMDLSAFLDLGHSTP